jgi:glycerol-3-phosphate dehydrogenase
MSSIDVTIIGAGSWGKALAHNLLKNNKKILMYSRQQVKQQQVNNSNISLTYELLRQ